MTLSKKSNLQEKNQDPDFTLAGSSIMTMITRSEHMYGNDDGDAYFIVTDKTYEKLYGYTVRLTALHLTSKPENIRKLVKFGGRHSGISTLTNLSQYVLINGINGLYSSRGGIAILEGNYNYSGMADIYTTSSRLGYRFLQISNIARTHTNKRAKVWLEAASKKLKNFTQQLTKKYTTELVNTALQLLQIENLEENARFKALLYKSLQAGLQSLTDDMEYHFENMKASVQEGQLFNLGDFYRRYITPAQIRYFKEYSAYNNELLSNFLRLYSNLELKRITDNYKNFKIIENHTDVGNGRPYDEIVLSNFRLKYFVMTDVLEKSQNENIKFALDDLKIPYTLVRVSGNAQDEYDIKMENRDTLVRYYDREIQNYTSMAERRKKDIRQYRKVVKDNPENKKLYSSDSYEQYLFEYRQAKITLFALKMMREALDKDSKLEILKVFQKVYSKFDDLEEIIKNNYEKYLSYASMSNYFNEAHHEMKILKNSRFYEYADAKKPSSENENEDDQGWDALARVIQAHLILPRRVASTKKVPPVQ